MSEEYSEGPFFTEITKVGKRPLDSIWVHIRELLQRENLDTSNFCLVGSWRSQPKHIPSVQEHEEWAKGVWRLKNQIFDSLFKP